MATDPFAPDAQTGGPMFRLNAKASGAYDAPWYSVDVTLDQAAKLLKVEPGPDDAATLWSVILRWNDLSFAAQADYAAKAEAKGKS